MVHFSICRLATVAGRLVAGAACAGSLSNWATADSSGLRWVAQQLGYGGLNVLGNFAVGLPLVAQQTETTHIDRGREPLQDGQRWHQAWALENLPPHAYAEFVRLRPGRVADLDRTVRRKGVPRGIAAGD